MNRITGHIRYPRPANDNPANDNRRDDARLTFSDADDNTIRRYRPYMTLQELGVMLNRKPRAVYDRARRLGVQKCPAISQGCKAAHEAKKLEVTSAP